MTTRTDVQTQIQTALNHFNSGSLRTGGLTLFNCLGYRSEKQLELESNTVASFLDTFNLHSKLNPERALLDEWQAVEFLFQLTKDEISQSPQLNIFTTGQVDNSIIESYLFLLLDLRGDQYSRTQLAHITREINKQFPMPVLLLFRYGPHLTLSVINRRLHKRDASKDVLEKVTLIKDINYARPHRAHVEILYDLSLDRLYQSSGFSNFVELHRAWQTTLDSSELNKRFFREVANWYFWAVDQVTFPPDAHSDPKVGAATGVIRLITRLIFVWFIKEKGLVPDDLFNKARLDQLLNYKDANDSIYYKAILQNLFFATLNQEMNTPNKSDNRKFRHRAKTKGQRDQHYLIHNVYRYERYFKDPAKAVELFASIPFLNGGLFECLDHKDPDSGDLRRIDGFSDRPDNPLTVPDVLFFGEEQEVDLNDIYGTSGRRYRVRGLLNILNSYKFTIAENTPIEEEIALDPELLGKVFENLLAAYNPETETTARKQTGSFYTPREIVNYMVDESLVAYLESQLQTEAERQSRTLTETKQALSLQSRLRHLLAYNEEPHQFSEAEVTRLIEAIDTLKILDPAAGSGAFPMGILHKLVFILAKLDPRNERWKERQIEKAVQIPDSTIRNRVIEEIEEAFERNELDYGRKLYLIENCIYGVDIQPIAVQIAKLRFFISLVVDQRIDDRQPNRGVLPLPNLETKFVAANTLLGIDKPPQLAFKDPAIEQKEKDLEEVRHRYFTARTPKTKEKYRQMDAETREKIGELLKQNGFRSATTEKLAQWNPYDQNASADFFDPEWMFGVMDGFDIVIGNPPYVQLQKDGGALAKMYQNAHYKTFARTGDIYALFYEKGYQILSSAGHLCYITSNKWMRAGYGDSLREFFMKHITPKILIDFGDAPLFANATTYTNILLFSKKQVSATPCQVFDLSHKTDLRVNLSSHLNRMKGTFTPQFSSDRYLIVNQAEFGVKQKVEQHGIPLKAWDIEIYRGIVSGYNQAFFIDGTKRAELIAADPKSAEIIKPVLRGKNIKRYEIDWQDIWLLFIPWHFPLHDDVRIQGSSNKAEKFFEKQYPAVYRHLLSHKKRLSSRNKTETGIRYEWYVLQRWGPNYYQEFDKEKIVWAEIVFDSAFYYDAEGYYMEATGFMMIGENIKSLVALLNSKLLTYTFKNYFSGGDLRGNTFRYKKAFLEQLPVIKANVETRQKLEWLVDQIQQANAADSVPETSALEAEIDQLVYQLYGLTDEEIAIVEEAVDK